MQSGIILSAFWNYLKVVFEASPAATVIAAVGCLALLVGGLCALYLLVVGDPSGRPKQE